MKITFTYSLMNTEEQGKPAIRLDGWVNGVEVGAMTQTRFHGDKEEAIRSLVLHAFAKGVTKKNLGESL
jgi:hypothetical protein